MIENDNNQLQEWRLTKLETDVTEIKNIVTKLDKKLSGIPESGLQCPLHMMKLDEYGKRLESVETKTDKMHSKIITWSAVSSVVLFLIAQLAIPYFLGNFKVVPQTGTATPAISQPVGNTNLFSGHYRGYIDHNK